MSRPSTGLLRCSWSSAGPMKTPPASPVARWLAATKVSITLTLRSAVLIVDSQRPSILPLSVRSAVPRARE